MLLGISNCLSTVVAKNQVQASSFQLINWNISLFYIKITTEKIIMKSVKGLNGIKAWTF
jgi:hypothetical protein